MSLVGHVPLMSKKSKRANALLGSLFPLSVGSGWVVLLPRALYEAPRYGLQNLARM